MRPALVRPFSAAVCLAVAACGQVLGIDELGFTSGACTADCARTGGTGGTGSAGADASAGDDASFAGSAGVAGAASDAGTPACTSASDGAPEREPECVGYVEAPCTFEDFAASAVRLSPDDTATGAMYLVEGDVLLADDAALRIYYDTRYVEPSASEHPAPYARSRWPWGKQRQLTYCVDQRLPAAVGSAMHSAAAAWERLADVQFVDIGASAGYCHRDNEAAVFRVGFVDTQAFAVAAAEAATDRAERQIEVSPRAFDSTFSLAFRLRHALGHMLGLQHGSPGERLCADARCEDRRDYLTTSTMRRDWCVRPGYPGQADQDALWRMYGAPTDAFFAGAGGVHARHFSTGEIFRLTMSFEELQFGSRIPEPTEWVRVAGPALTHVPFGSDFIRLTANGAIESVDLAGESRLIRESVGAVFACLPGYLCATDAFTGALYRAASTELTNWQRLGNPARMYGVATYRLYRIPAAGDAVQGFQELASEWLSIRNGPTDVLFGLASDGYTVDHLLATVADQWSSLPNERPGAVLYHDGEEWSEADASNRVGRASESDIASLFGGDVVSADWHQLATTTMRVKNGFRRDFDGNLWINDPFGDRWRFIGQPP